jgi:hypothetical protein
MFIIMMYMSCPAIRKLVAGDEVFFPLEEGVLASGVRKKEAKLA